MIKNSLMVWCFAFVLQFLLLPTVYGAWTNPPQIGKTNSGHLICSNHLFVKLKAGVTDETLTSALTSLDGTIESVPFLEGWRVVSWEECNIEEKFAGVKLLSEVSTVEYDAVAFPNNYYPPELAAGDKWNLDDISNAFGDINAPEAWAITRGDPTVGIHLIDSGWPQIDLFDGLGPQLHPDLGYNIEHWSAPIFCTSCRITLGYFRRSVAETEVIVFSFPGQAACSPGSCAV